MKTYTVCGYLLVKRSSATARIRLFPEHSKNSSLLLRET